jgi:hypothetical protein
MDSFSTVRAPVPVYLHGKRSLLALGSSMQLFDCNQDRSIEIPQVPLSMPLCSVSELLGNSNYLLRSQMHSQAEQLPTQAQQKNNSRRNPVSHMPYHCCLAHTIVCSDSSSKALSVFEESLIYSHHRVRTLG